MENITPFRNRVSVVGTFFLLTGAARQHYLLEKQIETKATKLA